MNPTLYPGQDTEIKDLAKNIDKDSDAKVTVLELLSFLDKKDTNPDQKKMLTLLASKENEVRKISWLEKAIRDLATQKITPEDLKKPLSALSDIQKSIILLNEWLYGGKAITWSEKPVDATNTAPKWVETVKSVPVLTDELWDKYTLKRTVATISGLPKEYVVNIDEVILWEDKKTAKISLYIKEEWKLVNKEVKDNAHNNDSQTTIKFEKNQDGSRWISKDVKDTDITLIRLQDGSQIVRLPLPDGSVKDMRFSLNNTNLSFSDYTPDKSYLDKLNENALWNGVKLWYINKKWWYVAALKSYVDKYKEDKAYYIADVLVNGKPNGQNMLFDQNGKPLPNQNYEIKAKWDKSKESFTTVDNAEQWYVNKNTDWQERDLQKVIEKWNFETKESDTTVKEVALSDDLVASGYVVDHVAGESVYHIANTKSGSLLDSGITITQSQLDKVKKWEKLPVFLKGMNNYYLLAVDSKTNKISLKEDKSISDQRKEMLQYYPTMLETVSTNKWTLPRYGWLQFGTIISDLKELTPQEDMYFSEDIGKKTKLIYQATVWLDKATVSQKTDIIKLEGKRVRGLPDWADVSGNTFINSLQEITVEDKNKLKIYKVGMRNNTIAFEEKASDSAIKEFVSSYKTPAGEELFKWKSTTSLKNAKWEDVWYLFDTTKSGTAQTYTAFDMKGNIISKLPDGSKIENPKIDINKVILDNSYEVKNKNEKIVDLTSQWNESQQLSEKIKSAPEKIKKTIKNGWFQQKNQIDRKDSFWKIIGFILDVSKTDTITIPATKNSKEQISSVENTYKVYFDLNGNIDNTKPVYKLNTDGSPQIIEQMQAEVVGDKLYITKPESLQKAKEDQQAHDKRKELLKWYPKDGTVRIEKNDKIYEISTEKAKEFAYSKLNNNSLAQQEWKYQKDLKFIQDTYNYKDDKLASYKDTPFYDKLQKLLNTDPDSFKKEGIEKIINEEKVTKQESLQPLTDVQKTELQEKVDEFIKNSDNFKEFDIKNATEVKSDGTATKIEPTKPSSTEAPKPPVIITKPEVIKDTKTGQETLKTPPIIKSSSDAKDVTPTWKKGQDGTFSNTLKTSNGWTVNVVIDTQGNVTTDKPTQFDVIKNADNTVSVVKKEVIAPTSTTWEDQPNKVLETQESNETLPDFRWVGYYKNNPATIKFVSPGKDTVTIKYTREQSRTDRSAQFKQILQAVKNSTSTNPAIATLKSSLSWRSSDIIRTVQDRAKKEGCNCTDFDDRKYGLNDTLLGINTYASLLLVLGRELKDNETINKLILDLQS